MRSGPGISQGQRISPGRRVRPGQARPVVPSQDRPATRSPASRHPVTRSPANHNPGSHNPGIRSPGIHSLVSHSPAMRTLASRKPAIRSPAIGNPASHSPGIHSPGIHSRVALSLAILPGPSWLPRPARRGSGAPGSPPPYYSPAPALPGPAFPQPASPGPGSPDLPRPPRIGSALTALVLGILGLLSSFLSPVLAIVFGIVALAWIRRTGGRGRAMAIAGIVLGVMWTGLTVVFIVLGVHAVNYGNLGRLQAGACFNNLQPGQVSTQVHFSSCSQPHNGQVVGTLRCPARPGRSAAALHREASAGCTALLGSVLRQHALGGGISALNYTPDQQAWSSGNRSASCVLLDPNSRHAGSMLAPSGP